ncbi:kringle domain protein, partial [Ancylostoma caninum]
IDEGARSREENTDNEVKNSPYCSGKPCIRWDEAPVRFPLESFSNVSTPSMDYITLKVFSTTISQHEDYCRNPDNHPYGPWCFYSDKEEIRRAPCFHTCITDIKQLCLAKAFFPFYQTPYVFDAAPLSPVDPRLLRTISDTKLKAMNDRVDLSDILDVPDVIRSIGQVTPLYSLTLTTRHLTQARLAGKAVVIRKK